MSIAVIVNLHARRGSAAFGRLVRDLLPGARVAVTSSLDQARRFIAEELIPRPPHILLSGGGDGTAVSILNELLLSGMPLPALGLLPLGTGNGWARETGAPRAALALREVAQLEGKTPPLRRVSLIEVEGTATPFAGTGWDAEIVSDYQKQLALIPEPLRHAQGATSGYLRSIFTLTVPRHLFGSGPATVTVTNLGDDALTVDAQGKVVPLAEGRAGTVLYQGPASVAGASTTPELGLGFRAFPFANAAPGRMAVRVYGASTFEATRNIVKLWKGGHPIAKSHDWLLTRCRMEFDREVPLEIGGDVAGDRRSVDFALSDRQVDLVDWRAMQPVRG